MAGDDSPTSPVLALRAAFGDRKPPNISRKITACVACRKQKIKCHMNDGQAPCTRCKARGLSCTVNRSLQMLLESDTSWKHAMEEKMRRLEAIVSRVARNATPAEGLECIEDDQADGPGNPSGGRSNDQPEDNVGRTETDADGHRDGDHGANHWDIVMDLDSGPGVVPGFYISGTPPSQAETGEPGPAGGRTTLDRQPVGGTDNMVPRRIHNTITNRDFIARGIVPLERAQAYFDNYHNRMDHFPYRILCDHGPVSLASLRVTSPLLVAAVCSVGALHTYTDDRAGDLADFDQLHAEFVAQCARKAMSKTCTMDDVRALCIGAFWLGADLSWSLVGTAVRMATQLQLHRSFRRGLGDGATGNDARVHYLRTRLWYLVYVCDHHFSVVYGRPPLTREDESVRDARRFINGPHATEDDARLVSQVLRWSLCSNIFDTFGVDATRALDDIEVPHLRRFGLALDGLRAEWVDRFRPNPHVGNYPRKGVQLQYNFAKLYLYSHAFRGHPDRGQRIRGPTETYTPAVPPTTTPAAAASTGSSPSLTDAAMDLDEAFNAGVLAALSILRAVVADAEIQSYLNGLPIYFDVMIAFAAVFLLKVASKYSASVLINVQEITSLVVTLVATLNRIIGTMHPRHLLVSITKGIDNLLQKSGLISCDKGGGTLPEHQRPEPTQDSLTPSTSAENDSDSIVVQPIHASDSEGVHQAVHEAHQATAQITGGHPMPGLFAADQAWAGHAQADVYFMSEYDFLMNQDMGFDMLFPVDPEN
ncbi:hypothetical protein HMPREF1624_01047 [Sporothrix schenckii ATCC 58251]|uniref:Zn(2)-C6 fungal-type domain-containing protein n=1 Tax=Sporothrix schenckii (strain ATCC 58251 / de Perez 2211183) TaxID=1391915 RepID=U7Q6S2_SPOS1|nr:hypothetical protein HMPREF1624_01047 [Sporothrix schenckii ATCC 58251]